MSLPHGGNIYHYSMKYGIPEEDFLDFSASINPLGPPKASLRAMRQAIPSVVNYPESSSLVLRDSIASRLDTAPASLLVGNGSTELIYLIARATGPCRALVFAPTFSDYERAARIAGCGVGYVRLKESGGFMPDMDALKVALDGVGLLFLCNPNNPTGTLLDKGLVLDILKLASKAGAFTVLDEAFIEYAPDASVISRAGSFRRAIVLRNFTKFYGMPGLRVGYMVSHPGVIGRMEKLKEPWSVNIIAQSAALAALSDEAYVRKSTLLMDREKAYLYGELSDMPGIHPYPPSVNFILAKLGISGPTASALAERLASKGILIRDCTNFRGLGGRYIRVAVRTRAQNDKLLKALAATAVIPAKAGTQ